MTEINPALKAASDHLNMLTANVKHLTAENAGLYRVFEVAMQLVSGQNDWAPAQREQLALAVKACNNAPNTAKAIRETESAGIDLVRQTVEKALKDGINPAYRPGLNACLGMVETLSRLHRSTAG